MPAMLFTLIAVLLFIRNEYAAAAGASVALVLVKETGSGIDRRRAQDLAALGVAAIDVGGSGGTSMVRIEGARSVSAENGRSPRATAFDGWGIPTAVSVLEVRDCGVPVIATGGVRSGVDAARAPRAR